MDRRFARYLLPNEYLPWNRQLQINKGLVDRLSPFLEFSHPEGFVSVGGTAHYLNADGSMVSFRFQTIDNRGQFDSLVRQVEEKCAEGAIIERSESGNEVRISNDAYVRREPGDVVIRKMPWFLAYSDGICGWGGRSFSADAVARVKEVSADSSRRDWAFFAAPRDVVPEYREMFLSLLARELGVQKQRFDGEREQDFAARHAWIEQTEWFIQHAMSDIQQVTFWMDDPRDEEPSFRAHLKVDLVPESALSKMVASMRTTSLAERNTGVVGHSLIEADAAFSLPKEIRGWMSDLVRQRVSSAMAADALSDWIDDGLVNVSFRWNCDDGGRSSFEGTVYSPLPEEKLDSVVAVMGINSLDRIMPISLAEPDVGLVMRNVFLQTWGRTGDIQFTIRSDDQTTATTTASVVPKEVSRRPYSRGATLTIKGNLNPLAKWKRSDNVDVLSWLEYFERLYEYERTQKSDWFLQRTGRKPLQLFESIQPSWKADYDLNFDLKLQCSPDGESITADLRVSKDLYGLFLARKRLTERSIFLLPKKNETLAP